MDQIDSPEMTAGDLALLLWADSRAGRKRDGRDRLPPPQATGRRPARPRRARAELGRDRRRRGRCATSSATALCERQLERASAPGRLFRHRDSGRRARFPNFATQIYGVLALAVAARERARRRRALATARRVAGRLLELQRPDGGWPWIFDAQRGTVVEPYEIYSVHQDAMAPMALLELSEVTGDAKYRDAAIRGLDWIFGQNDLGREMLDRDAGILYRSIRRKRASTARSSTRTRRRRSLGGAALARRARPARGEPDRPPVPPGLDPRGLGRPRAGYRCLLLTDLPGVGSGGAVDRAVRLGGAHCDLVLARSTACPARTARSSLRSPRRRGRTRSQARPRTRTSACGPSSSPWASS